MPYRKYPIVKGEIYHVFNRSIAGQPIFLTEWYYQRALEVLHFYSFKDTGLRFSHYNQLPRDRKISFLNKLKSSNEKMIQLLVFCIMPNHFHFLIKEIYEGGIKTFTSNFQNSLAKFFNIKNERNGALFQAMFRAVRIVTDEQFIHVARYIHLNPLTSYIIREAPQLEGYKWCSFADYLGNRKQDLIDKDLLLSSFPSIKKFKEFTYNQIDYQRKLDFIKHLISE